MAGQDTPVDPAKALEFKEKGNKCFQAGDFVAAEALYSKAFVPLPHLSPSPPRHNPMLTFITELTAILQILFSIQIAAWLC
jgi:hypothetical protein